MCDSSSKIFLSSPASSLECLEGVGQKASSPEIEIRHSARGAKIGLFDTLSYVYLRHITEPSWPRSGLVLFGRFNRTRLDHGFYFALPHNLTHKRLVVLYGVRTQTDSADRKSSEIISRYHPQPPPNCEMESTISTFA